MASIPPSQTSSAVTVEEMKRRLKAIEKGEAKVVSHDEVRAYRAQVRSESVKR